MGCGVGHLVERLGVDVAFEGTCVGRVERCVQVWVVALGTFLLEAVTALVVTGVVGDGLSLEGCQAAVEGNLFRGLGALGASEDPPAGMPTAMKGP